MCAILSPWLRREFGLAMLFKSLMEKAPSAFSMPGPDAQLLTAALGRGRVASRPCGANHKGWDRAGVGWPPQSAR